MLYLVICVFVCIWICLFIEWYIQCSRPRAYLAAPFFTDEENKIYDDIIKQLRCQFNLYVPKHHTIKDSDKLSNREWARAVFKQDIKAIKRSKYIIVINYSMYSDSGTAWECGYAFAKRKHVINVLLDDANIMSLMMINGSHTIIYKDQLYKIKSLLHSKLIFNEQK